MHNSDFSQEFADTTNKGEETPENVRYEWEDEFRINEVISNVEIKREQEYLLTGESGENEPFSYSIPNVTTFLFQTENGITPLVFSEKALVEYVLDTEKNRLEVYLNDDEVVENPIPGIYIILSDFPKVLRN